MSEAVGDQQLLVARRYPFSHIGHNFHITPILPHNRPTPFPAQHPFRQFLKPRLGLRHRPPDHLFHRSLLTVGWGSPRHTPAPCVPRQGKPQPIPTARKMSFVRSPAAPPTAPRFRLAPPASMSHRLRTGGPCAPPQNKKPPAFPRGAFLSLAWRGGPRPAVFTDRCSRRSCCLLQASHRPFSRLYAYQSGRGNV